MPLSRLSWPDDGEWATVGGASGERRGEEGSGERRGTSGRSSEERQVRAEPLRRRGQRGDGGTELPSHARRNLDGWGWALDSPLG